ncbi:MAG: hypothetical protein QNJ94_16210 [Alphaproteobacteria bacterium]|nr:hypothetical protein [Alphaproteobacteria bacterium]
MRLTRTGMRLALSLALVAGCLAGPAGAVTIDEWLTLDRREQSIYVIAVLETRYAMATLDGRKAPADFNDYLACIDDVGLDLVRNMVTKLGQANKDDKTVPVASYTLIALRDLCKDKN